MPQRYRPATDDVAIGLVQGAIGCFLLAFGFAHDGPTQLQQLAADIDAWSTAAAEADYASDS